MDRRAITGLALVCLSMLPAANAAAAGEAMSVNLRGKPFVLQLYHPSGAAPPKGTILMGSGDVGWVGLAVDLAGFLSTQGYAVVGINSRLYLSMWTSGASHVTPEQVASDYAGMVQQLRDRHALWEPVIVAGVSEGAALAVLAGGPANHQWARGVITMGLPTTAEMAWRWKDAMSWVTGKDAAEPSVEPARFVGAISPHPLFMIQSTKDEYVTEADYRAIEQAARAPKQQVLVDAKDHRFTDRLPLLRQHVLAGIDWILSQR